MHERIQIIVYFKTPKVLKRVKKMGNITYYHKKRKYAIVYINKEKAENIVHSLGELRDVKRVEYSKLDFEDALSGTLENETQKEHDKTTQEILNEIDEESPESRE